MNIQRTSKNVGKTEDIVDLVGVIGAPGGNNCIRASLLGNFVRDLRIGICHRKDDGLPAHPLDHFSCQDVCNRYPDKDIRTFQCFCQCTGLVALGIDLLFREHGFLSALIDQPGDIAHPDMLHWNTQLDELIGAGNSGCTGTRENDLDLMNFSIG